MSLVADNTDYDKKIERFYILLLEGNCNEELFFKVKSAIKENWIENQNNLDAWVLYFIVLQKEKNILNNLDVEENIGTYLLNKINNVVNNNDNSLTVGIKSKEEINNIIHELVYKEVEKFFDDIFSKIAPNFDYIFSLPFERTGNIGIDIIKIINNFNNNFNTNKDYKNKIIEIFLHSAKKGQEKINKEQIQYCKKGEYLYNQYLNYCFGDFFQDIGINQVPFVEFKFCNSSLWFLQTKLLPRYSTCLFLFLYPFIFSFIYAFGNFDGFNKAIQAIFVMLMNLDILLTGMLVIEWFPRLIDRFSKVKEMEKAKKQYVVNSNRFSQIETVINQAMEVLKSIPQNDEVDNLVEKIKRYKDLINSFDKMDTPSAICSLNVYLLPFLNNIIKEKEKISLQDILSSKEAFDSANDSLLKLQEQQEIKVLTAKQIEFDIAKHELDFLNSQLVKEKIPVTNK